MKYQILLLPSAKRDIDAHRGKEFKRIAEVLRSLSRNPRPVGSQKLTGEEGHRIRIGNYRVLYRIDDGGKKVFVYRIRHRREVYR